MVALVYRVSVEIDSIATTDVANKKSKAKKTKNKTAHVPVVSGETDSGNMNDYVTGFDAYVEELNGGRDDK